MDDFDLERDLEDAGIDAFDFSFMDEDERREVLEDAGLTPELYLDADMDPSFDAWSRLQTAGLSLWELDLMDEDERRETLEDAGLDPDDYEWTPGIYSVAPTPAPAPPPEPQEAPPGPPAERKVYRYCRVRLLTGGSGDYLYWTEDRTVAAGDYVMVPFGGNDAPRAARVFSAGDYDESVAPFPPDKTKRILRRATRTEITAGVQPEKSAPPAESAPVPDRPADIPAGVDPRAEEKPVGRKRTLWVIAGALIAAGIVAGGVLYAIRGGGTEEVRRTPAPAPTPTESPAPTDTPMPTDTPVPVWTGDKTFPLDDALTDSTIGQVLDGTADVSRYLAEYSEKMWLPDAMTLDYTDIMGYEETWAGYERDMSALLGYMDGYEPSELFRSSWEDLYAFVEAIQRVAHILSDWDINHDGEYTVKEVDFVNTMANNAALEGKERINQMTDDLDQAEAQWKEKLTPTTPKPTPRRTTPTPKPTAKPDPYHADEFYDPEDFYDEYYDDFWDYEDAEDYWYDHN